MIDFYRCCLVLVWLHSLVICGHWKTIQGFFFSSSRSVWNAQYPKTFATEMYATERGRREASNCFYSAKWNQWMSRKENERENSSLKLFFLFLSRVVSSLSSFDDVALCVSAMRWSTWSVLACVCVCATVRVCDCACVMPAVSGMTNALLSV